MYIPKDHKLRIEIIKLHHDTPSAGHPGQWKTLELITYNYWWPGVIHQVKGYVTGCDHCQRMKSFPEKPTGKLRPNEAMSVPWKDILLLDSLKLKDTTLFLLHVAIIQNRHILFLPLQKPQLEALPHYLEIMPGNFMVYQKPPYLIEVLNLLHRS